MAASKQYGTEDQYEKKLEKVMDVDRVGYKGNLYRFDHSVVKAKAKGIDLRYGSDAFAQLVLALEDLARMAERGIYDQLFVFSKADDEAFLSSESRLFDDFIQGNEQEFGYYAEGRFAWELANIERIEPIPAKGQLGLWNYQVGESNE